MNKYQAELYHHGIKGQKWGVRRFQNSDGSLTDAGNKRYGQKYQKAMIKYQKDQIKSRRNIKLQSYNKTVDEYNNGKIAEYNKSHKTTDPDYLENYIKQFNEDWKKNYNRSMMEFTQNNRNFQKADAIAKKYGLYSTDELAKKNKAFVEDMLRSDYSLDPSTEEARKKYGSS